MCYIYIFIYICILDVKLERQYISIHVYKLFHLGYIEEYVLTLKNKKMQP